MKYLGIDYGTKRIGLATSSEDAVFAFPYSVIPNDKKTIEELKNIIEKEKIEGIVLGLSLDQNGKENPICEKIKKLGTDLGEVTNLPIQYERETWTSVEAVRSPNQKSSRDARKTKKEIVSNIDARAAQIILARFLERNNK